MTEGDKADSEKQAETHSPVETALSYKEKAEAAFARVFHFGWVWAIILITYKLASWVHVTFNIPVPNWSEPGFSLFGQLIDWGVRILLWVPSVVVRPIYELVDQIFSLYLPSFEVFFWSWREVALVSIISSRLFDASYIFVPLADRDAARNSMTSDMRREISQAEGVFAGLHNFLHLLNRHIYSARDWLSVHATTLLRKALRLRPPTDRVDGPGRLNNQIANKTLVFLIGDFCAALFFWGYIKAVGYSVAVLATLRLKTPQPKVWRQTVYMVILNLVIAMIATFIFYVSELAMISDS